MMRGTTRQEGAALVIGLIMLLVMTLMGVTSMSTTQTELKIANNMNNHSSAFQTAASMIERAMVNPAIVWDAVTVNPKMTYTSVDTFRTGELTMTFMGCRRSVIGSSLTGSAGSSIVHKAEAIGNAVNINGDVVGVSRQTSGFLTLVAGCR